MQRGGLFLVVPLVLLLLPAILLAGEPPVPIDGKLVFNTWDLTESASFVMEGASDNVTPLNLSGCLWPDASPRQDRYAVTVDLVPGTPETGVLSADVGTVALDGSGLVNISQLAGLGGINCGAIWSPDATQVAFIHCDPVVGMLPCEAGFSVWVANADGSGAHQASPAWMDDVMTLAWAPNGYRLLCRYRDRSGGGEGYHFTVDSDGTDYQQLPDLGGFGDWSRDGSKIVTSWYEGGEYQGQEGHWRTLRIWNVDGTEYEEPLRFFISQAEVMEIVEVQGLAETLGELAGPAIIAHLGPAGPIWSPRGDRVAFMGALDYDPYGPYFELQAKLWVYDLETHVLTRLTNTEFQESAASWDGHNTFSYDTEVMVDNTTVVFEEVADEGLTTIIRDDDLPDLPTGFMFAGESYRITTTCTPSGSIMVEMTYRDEDIPTSTEETLCIYHWDEDSQTWEDITVSRDPVNNIVTGITDSLSPFGMTVPQRFTDVTFSHWGYAYIEVCYAAGIVGGYPNGTYQPDWAVTRGQMAIYISRALAAGDENVPTGPAQPSFVDVPSDDICYKYIEYAVDNHVVFGYPGDGLYHPEYDVDRGQMAVFVARAIATPTGEPGMATYTPTTTTFADVTSDPLDPYDVCYPYVEYIAEKGVTQGYPDGLYHPEYIVSRGLMAIYVARAFGLL